MLGKRTSKRVHNKRQKLSKPPRIHVCLVDEKDYGPHAIGECKHMETVMIDDGKMFPCPNPMPEGATNCTTTFPWVVTVNDTPENHKMIAQIREWVHKGYPARVYAHTGDVYWIQFCLDDNPMASRWNARPRRRLPRILKFFDTHHENVVTKLLSELPLDHVIELRKQIDNLVTEFLEDVPQDVFDAVV